MWEVKVYLKSGQTVKVKCKDYTFRYNHETLDYTGYEFTIYKSSNVSNDFVPSQIAGFTAKKKGLFRWKLWR